MAEIITQYMTENPCYKKGRKIAVKGLMLHSIGCSQPNPEVFVKNWNNPSYNKACVHGFIGLDKIFITLPCMEVTATSGHGIAHRAWHCGAGSKGSANNTHIGIEMCEPSCIKYVGGANVYNRINAYDTHKGFLYYWSADEKALLKDMTLTLANPIVAGGGSYTWTGKVWLPTYTQMGGGQNNGISEGEAFSKFTNEDSRIKSLHPNCAINNEYCKLNKYAGGRNLWYCMSSVDPYSSYTIHYVDYDGSIDYYDIAYIGDNGFAPCICLPIDFGM